MINTCYTYKGKQAAASTTISLHPWSDGVALRILIVDDDPAICSMLKTMLTMKGHRVETYLDPTATPIIQAPVCPCPCEATCTDVMLIDYFMPQMNGLEFLRLLEGRGCKVPRQRMAVITAHYSAQLGHELDQLGVKYFKKPFKLPELNGWLAGCAS